MSAVWKNLRARTLAWPVAIAVVLASLVGAATPANAAGTGSISGVVTDSSSAPVEGVVITVYRQSAGDTTLVREDVVTAADGTYAVEGLDDGDYLVWFATVNHAGALRAEWWDDAEDMDDATPIRVEGGAVAGIDPELTLIGEFAGQVTDEEGAPLPDIDVVVTARDVPGFPGLTTRATTSDDGEYVVAGLPEGDYTVRFDPESGSANVLPEWWDDASSEADAATVTVRANDPRLGVDAELAKGAVLAGRLTGPGARPLAGAEVTVLMADGLTWVETAAAHTDSNGDWSVHRLYSGNYRVRFDATISGIPYQFFWAAPGAEEEASLIGLGAGGTRKDLNLYFRPVPPPPLEPGVPVIVGTPRVGQTLTVDPGDWLPGVFWNYEWLADESPISSPDQPSLTLTPELAGKTISVTVTGYLSDYLPTDVTSAPTAPVAGLPLTAGTPSVTGVLAVGSTVTAKPGTWTAGTTFSYQWYANGKAIAGATKASLAIGTGLRGAQLSVTVTGTKAGYAQAAKSSAKTAKVATAATPKISGKAKVGKKLTAKPGAWTSGTKFSYQWYANGKAIKGAKKSTLTLKKAHKGKKITVTVTGKKSGYATVAKTSKATGAVKK